MTTPLDQALELLLTGMLTVGIVLGMVVITGQMLIKTMNLIDTSSPVPSPPQRKKDSSIDPATVAVLTATVEVVTQGKGSIKRIDPI